MSRSRRTTPDQRLALLRQRLKDLSPNTMTADLRSALCDESNFVVEQVAKVVREHTLSELIPDLVSAYHRFLKNGAECDKGCRAKLAIVEALLPLDFEEADFWLAGMQYRQQEPVWGGSIDTAIDVRGVCAFGLVRSRQPEAVEFLISRINTASPDAVYAIRALAPIRSYDNIANRVLAAVQASGSRELAAAHRTEFLPQHDAAE